jgi:hypothetical protein
MSRKTTTEQKQQQQTNYSGAFMTPPRTEEDDAVAEWTPDRTLLTAGQKAIFNRQRQAAGEAASAITNPYARMRAEQIALEDIGAAESSAISDAAAGDAETDLRRKMFLSAKRSPQYIQTGANSTGTGSSTTVQPFNWGALLGGGLGLASAFIKPV